MQFAGLCQAIVPVFEAVAPTVASTVASLSPGVAFAGGVAVGVGVGCFVLAGAINSSLYKNNRAERFEKCQQYAERDYQRLDEYVGMLTTVPDAVPPLRRRMSRKGELKAFMDELKRRFDATPTPVVCGIIEVFFVGLVSSGKSSLINALLGSKVCKKDIGDAMLVGDLIIADLKVELYDCPGIVSDFGTDGLRAADVLVVVYKDSIDYIEEFVSIAVTMNKRFLFVRTHCDCAEEDEIAGVLERDAKRFCDLLGRPCVCVGVCARNPQMLPRGWEDFQARLMAECAAAVAAGR
jgi:hypothetical protein